MNKEVYTIIVIYNGLRNNWIDKCFTSLFKSNYPTKIIAVDNNSSDNSFEYISEHYPEVILLKSEKNLGFGGANNLGIKYALETDAEYFFLLNQDAYVREDSIAKLIYAFENNSDYSIISPMHLNGEGTGLDYNFSIQASPTVCKELFSDFVVGSVRDKIYTAYNISAAAWMLNKSTLKEIGGFNPTFFHYGEEDNYCDRLRYFNKKIGIYPFSYILHDREFRPKTQYDTTEYIVKRNELIKFSDPKNIGLIDTEIKCLRIFLFNLLLRFRFKHVINNYSRLKYLKSIRNNINLNNLESISSKEFKFL